MLEKNIIEFIFKSSVKSFTTAEIKNQFVGVGETQISRALTNLTNKGIITSFGEKRGIFVVGNSQFFNYDFLYLSQRIAPNSVIGFETSLAYFGILKNVPQMVYSAIKNKSLAKTGYHYKNYEFTYRILNDKLFNLGIVLQNGLKIYEPEKALLDYIYITIKTIGKDFVNLDSFFLEKLDKKKLEKYLILGDYSKFVKNVINENFKDSETSSEGH